MLRIGAEEPLGRNDWIYSYDPSSDSYIFDSDSSSVYNRYSITSDSLDELWNVLICLIPYLLRLFDCSCSVLYGVSRSGAMWTPARLRLLQSKLVKAGFCEETYEDFLLYALKVSEFEDIPNIVNFKDGRAYLVFGGGATDSLCMKKYQAKDLVISLSRSFAAPNIALLNSLDKNLSALGYVAHDHEAKSGFILLSRNSINLRGLGISVLSTVDVFYGKDAQRAWN